MEISGQVIRDHNHDVIGVLGIARDLRPKHISEQLLLKNIHMAEEKERKRLSTEIHDGIGPILSAINLYLGTATSGNISREKEIELLGKVQHSVTEVANELRNISNNLIPVEFVNRTLVENISILAERLSTGAGVHCQIISDHFNPFISDEKSLVVYRIISELLNNTIRHGKASKIEIVFKHCENDIMVSYNDNGSGFNMKNQQKHPTGLGLNSIKTRLKTLDATFLFFSEPGKGMKIEFSFANELQKEQKK
jgi:signal transduction histidine kinase